MQAEELKDRAFQFTILYAWYIFDKHDHHKVSDW